MKTNFSTISKKIIQDMANMSKTSSKRMSHTAAQKLKIIQYAEEHGNRPAARHFGVSESCVRLWRKTKISLSAMPKSKKANRGTDPSFPDMEKELLNFVSNLRASGVGVITSEVRLCALSLVDKYRFQYPDISHFKASPGWCYRFMARHNLSARRRTATAQRLPGDYEDKLLNYQRFTINQRQIHN